MRPFLYLADAPLDGPPSKWEYVDPKGNIQGPFPASDLVKWANGGFFSSDQQVCWLILLAVHHPLGGSGLAYGLDFLMINTITYQL